MGQFAEISCLMLAMCLFCYTSVAADDDECEMVRLPNVYHGSPASRTVQQATTARCAAACMVDQKCLAATRNNKNNNCHLHYKIVPLTGNTKKGNHHHDFFIKKCSGELEKQKCKMLDMEDVRQDGPIINTYTVQESKDCSLLCQVDPACVAASFIEREKKHYSQCLIHYDKGYIIIHANKKSDKKEKYNYMYYLKACEPAVELCGMVITVGAKQSGTSYRSNKVHDVYSCLAICGKDAKCKAANFVKKRCYLFAEHGRIRRDDDSDEEDDDDDDDDDHKKVAYIHKSCETTLVTENEYECFKRSDKTRAKGGIKVTKPDTRSEQGCVEFCRKTRECQAVDFAYDLKECRMHKVALRPESTKSNMNVQFVKKTECKDPCDIKPCSGDAVCSSVRRERKCSCPEHYEYIDTVGCRVIDFCTDSPCKGGATCVPDVGGYVCKCKEHYQYDKGCKMIDYCLASPCKEGSTCRPKVGGYDCKCDEHYEYDNGCKMIDYCLDSPCKEGSTCVPKVGGFDCKCDEHYEYDNGCKMIDYCLDSPCKEGSTCVPKVGGYDCKCDEHYYYYNGCKMIDFCLDGPCKEGSTCVPKVGGHDCKCDEHYEYDNECKMIDYCLNSPCKGGSTCVPKVGGYDCKCDEHYEYDNGCKEINYCLDSPCKEGSTSCVPKVGGYDCTCENHYEYDPESGCKYVCFDRFGKKSFGGEEYHYNCGDYICTKDVGLQVKHLDCQASDGQCISSGSENFCCYIDGRIVPCVCLVQSPAVLYFPYTKPDKKNCRPW